MRRSIWAMASAAALLSVACDTGDGDDGLPGIVADPVDEPADGSEPAGGTDGDEDTWADAPTPAQTRAYMRRIAPFVVGRNLTLEEDALIRERGAEAIDPIIEDWLYEPGFNRSVRYFVEQLLHTSGSAEGIDYGLPGNLGEVIAAEGLPWSTLLTADYCVDENLEAIECDTGSPYNAGALTTRAYMASNASRFNLQRAKRLIETFACRLYPMEHDLQPPLPKEVLIPLFRAETAEEQEVEEAKDGFGNGIGCYHCHSQFGAHAQLFVRYDTAGLWRADATGVQAEGLRPDGVTSYELGESYDGLFASHMEDPAAKPSESTQVLGEQVTNLRDAAKVVTQSPLFAQCTVKNLVAQTFGLEAGTSKSIAEDLVADLARIVTADDVDPGIEAYVRTVFTDRRVIVAFVDSMEADP